ncbi:hypothetical protein CPB83DRAFT_897333 [Crepidotus variabilis]|uniref:Uncharacterized protein n=1 Tax=Crepidotus variabilis TaxID=179855 RepID=A0A9P6E971_9AGAR|nr:hypothetical protein CPB83DRAFT_897333 [Crepidotus variabilis]
MQTSSSLFRAATNQFSTAHLRCSRRSLQQFSCVRFSSSTSWPQLARSQPCISHKTLPRPTRRTYNSHVSHTTDVVFDDPHRPDLFYHLVKAPTPLSSLQPAYALSFLREPPPHVDSPVIIGWLPAQTIQETPSNAGSPTQERGASLQDFVGNPKFITFLHDTIRSGLKESVDEIWKDAALQYQQGWMHIHDQRNPPDQGRIGDPDDIIASVLVEDSVLRPETYQPMPSYRICTSDGVIQLTPGLSEYLRKALRKCNA